MRSDFEMIVHDFERGKSITIIPISDVHLGAVGCMEKEFRQFIKNLEELPDTYITLGGDLINNGLRSSVGNPFDELYRPREQKRMMADILYPVRDKILCGVGGNHEARSIKDSDSDITLDIFSKLDIEHLYRPNMAFMQLRFGHGEKNLKGYQRPSYTVGVIHGAGGGGTYGAPINRNTNFANAIDGLDALIVGHSHKPAVTCPAKLRVDPCNKKVSVVPFKCIISTAWLDYGGYALNKQLMPASHSLQTMHLNGSQKELIVTV